MSGQWSPAGGSAQTGAPQIRGERTAATLSAVITALALIAVLVVALATSDDAGGGTSGSGTAGLGGSSVSSSDGSSGTSGSSGSGGSDGSSSSGGSAVPGGSSTAHNVVNPQVLKNEFPLPPGTTADTNELVGKGEKAYQVRATLAGVKAFFTKQLPRVGVPVDHWLTDTGGPKNSVIGYLFGYTQTDGDLPFSLTINMNSLQLGHGLVFFEVTLVCGPNPNPVTSPAC